MPVNTVNADVVVVGGGPTGLALAGDLAVRGLVVVVLERRTGPVEQSRATTLHPRTLEVLDARGWADRFVARSEELLGRDPRIPVWHFATLPGLRFDLLDSRFPFTLWLPQQETESLLAERATGLGVRLLRGHDVTALTLGADGVAARAQGPAGEVRVEAGWVVGCDGAGSTVRRAAGIGFSGTPTTRTAIVADVRVREPLPGGRLNAHNATGQVMAAPLDRERVRFVVVHGERSRAPKDEPVTLTEVSAVLLDVIGTDHGVHEPAWLSRFGNASRLATRYRAGRAFLAGDAAHMHFPTGGQGLNHGIQDAANLGWKLATHVLGEADDALLDSYEAERRPAGQRLLYDVSRQSGLMAGLADEAPALRRFFAEELLPLPNVNRMLAEQISGLALRYGPGDGHPLTGTRLPDLRVSTGGRERRVYELLRAGVPVSLALDGDTCLVDAPAAYAGLAGLVVRPDAYVGWASTTSAPVPPVPAVPVPA
ncbi:monooxygenase [Kineococcus sp. NUM-3379]